MKKLINYFIKIEVIKYLFIGGLSTIFSFLIFTGCLYSLKFNYLVALTIASIISILFTYTLNFMWVFKPEERLRFQERFIKYLLSNSTSFILNIIVLHYIVSTTHYDPFYVQLAIVPPLIAVNFLITKFWSMRRYYAVQSNTQE